MGWIDIGALDADRTDWQLSQPFEGNLIKIDNDVSSPTFTSYNQRGLIAINYGFEDFLDIKIFYSSPKSQLFLFPNINLNKNKHLAVKSINSRKTNNQWTVRAFVLDSAINNDNFVFVQSSPSNQWVINHTLNKTPQIIIYDENNQVIIGDISIINNNQVIINFTVPITGKAILS